MENHKKLAHLLDVTQCVGCSACIVACAQTNYPDMLNAENTGWESLPANIRRVSAELARRPVELLVQCQPVCRLRLLRDGVSVRCTVDASKNGTSGQMHGQRL